jgi:hypothetical protein
MKGKNKNTATNIYRKCLQPHRKIQFWYRGGSAGGIAHKWEAKTGLVRNTYNTYNIPISDETGKIQQMRQKFNNQ